MSGSENSCHRSETEVKMDSQRQEEMFAQYPFLQVFIFVAEMTQGRVIWHKFRNKIIIN